MKRSKKKPAPKQRWYRVLAGGVPTRLMVSPPAEPRPRSKPATPRPPRTPAVPGALTPLVWVTASPAHRTAPAAGGTYLLLTHDACVTWSAEWRPTRGDVQRLGFRLAKAQAEDACETHRTLLDANARLVADGHEELVGNDITGEAIAWKRGGRR